MIRMIQSNSAGHAKAYFSEALSKSDYYLSDQELQGRFNGKLSERLGITGPASKETFFALCENINPKTGETLTLRTKEERKIGYDINFHCPKSVSMLHALSQDSHIVDAFQKCVADTMLDIEADTKTRVRKEGKYEDRDTEELAWAEFIHQTSRPVDDHAPDPHLHAHCFVFNATWDDVEKQFKAGKFHDIKRDMPYYQARFHKRLSDQLIVLGYQVRLTDKSFEIEGVPQKVIDQFSKRTDEIGRIAKERGITDAKELDGLGARTRSKKQKGLTMAELKSEWRRQIKELGQDDVDSDGTQPVRFAPVKDDKTTPQHCVDHALKHSFERASVLADRKILKSAYRFALGDRNVSLNDITDKFKKDVRIIEVKEGSRKLCTTREVLREEQRMVELARQGKNKLAPLYQIAPDISLKDQQAAAISHLLTTRDRVSIIRGAAGTGKTTLMREAVSHIEKAGKTVMVVAPTAQASRGVLKEEGFANADTVTKLLSDPKMQNSLAGQVLWVDEAGLLGTKDMSALLELATKQNARLILGGDTRQHASVVRGDALRVLNVIGGIRAAEVSKIYRQKDVRYREAVKDLSEGNIKRAFSMLDAIGAIETIDPVNPNEKLVDDYVSAIKKGKTALVVSPTHKQGDAVTDAIREKLKKAKIIGKKEISAKRLSNLNMTEAERSDWRNFKEGQIIQFNQHSRGIKRGSVWTVVNCNNGKVQLKDDSGNQRDLPLSKADKFDVFRKSEIGIAKGDKIQITKNGFDKNDKRLNNGTTLDVVSVKKNGKIVLRNKSSKSTYEVDKDFGHLSHAHCITSHASQGKTVDETFISQPASTFSATDAKQFYVSVSRGREAVRIYTDDRDALLDHASEMGDRQSAMELMNITSEFEHIVQLQILEYERMYYSKEVDHKIRIDKQKMDIDYEPEF